MKVIKNFFWLILESVPMWEDDMKKAREKLGEIRNRDKKMY